MNIQYMHEQLKYWRYKLLARVLPLRKAKKYRQKRDYLGKLLGNPDYKLLLNSPYFDCSYYLKNNPDVAKHKMYPVEHYLKYGWKEGRSPSPLYNFKFYLECYPDLVKAQVNPVLHYLKYGYRERRILYKNPDYQSYSFRVKRKYVIYTCITGNYDTAPEYLYFDDKYDYVLFTDSEKLIHQKRVGIWRVRPLQFDGRDSVRNARWHKTHPHVLFPNYSYSIWIDGNIKPLGEFVFRKISQFISRDVLIAVPPHFWRNDCYEEAAFLSFHHFDLPELINKEIKVIKQSGLPEQSGLQETNIVLRKHNQPQLVSLDDEWWNFIDKYSRRDQICFNYLCWKYKVELHDFCDKTEIRVNPQQVYLYEHARRRTGNKTCKTISVIIPVFNALAETKNLIASIKKSHLSANVDITLINDKSDSETTEYLRKLNRENPQYRLIENKNNMQFVRTCNKGMACVTGDIIVLLNNDTLIPENWEKRILDCFNSDSDIGIASPVASGSGLWDIPFNQGMNFEMMDRHVEKVSKKEYPVVLCPEGFCFAIRRECFNEIGFLDEIFCPIYCEETDYALRALKAGWKTVIIDNLYMFHKRHASVGSEFRKKQIEKNWKILMQRHADIWAIRETKYNTTGKINKIKEMIQRG